MPFVEVPFDVDEATLLDDVVRLVQGQFPDWQPSNLNLDFILLVAFVRASIEARDVAADVPAEVFKAFGEKLVNVPPNLATPASASTTWTMIDDTGYTINAGTLVGIRDSENELRGFVVQNEVVVAPGDTATAAGEVLIVAQDDGEELNNLSGDVSLLDALDYVSTITLVGTTDGGADAEDPEVYLGRLSDELQLMSPRPILPDDYAVLAKAVPGIGRALALDTYNPDDDTFDNPGYMAVAVAEADGSLAGAPAKSAAEALLTSDGQRWPGVTVNIIDPTYTSVDVAVYGVSIRGADTAQVADDVRAAVEDFLDPANWATDEFGPSWRDALVVRVNEVISLADKVSGLDYVPSGGVTLAETGDPLTDADLTLNGVAPLPQVGDVYVHIVDPEGNS